MIIVGSGPAGLVLSLLLTKQGISVVILEAAKKLDENPRATHYSYPATYEPERTGVLQDVKSEGYLPAGVSWRDIDGRPLATISTKELSTEQKMVCLPLNHLARILMEHIAKEPTAEVKCLGHVETPTGTEKISADYIVGCDGANSQIRRSLFGDMGFPGRTWDEQIVATNVYYDMTPYDWGDSSFIIDKEHWSMVAKIQKDGLLRVTCGEIPGLTREEYIARQPMKFKAFLPGRPNPDQYKLVSISPYKIHQRCAKTHLCNPFGGLGLTGVLVDAGNLFDCLNGIHQGLASNDILSHYDTARRSKYNVIIDPVSSENIRRLWQDPAVNKNEDKFFEMCRMAEADPEVSRKMQERDRVKPRLFVFAILPP
ncbi:putative monooxygenase [Rhexocercosporidium sp. MPI-PUGE-AT-0058]|nr:putative monooxygenase [Rhexocercosporidium sp. MPI-PUGE-AT-0058]